ncbi:endothelin-converting enzyme 2-like [Musca autumnalis]|uniref:endothelin-converting enzyme 2-like n=1 Tax=Musca autumnalis TaxID=221902 RepID=UPI003CEFE99B
MRFEKHKMNFVLIISLVILMLAEISSTEFDLTKPYVKEILRRSKSGDIKSWMNPKVRPCDNFYEYACGNWQRINKADNRGEYMTNKFKDLLTDGLNRKVNTLLNNFTPADSINSKLQDFYKSCIDMNSKSANYQVTLRRIFEEYGKLSFLGESLANAHDHETESTFNVWSTVAEIKKVYGTTILLSVDVQADFKNSSITRVYLGPPDLPTDFNEREEDISLYLSSVFQLREDKVSDVTSTFVQLEMDISQIEEGDTDDINDMLEPYSLDHLYEKYPSFDVKSFLEIALDTTNIPEQIYIFDEAYFRNLIAVINSSDPVILQDYILWRLVEEYLVDTSSMAASDKEDFCTRQAKRYFGEFMDHTIYEEYRSQVYEEELFKLWQEIKASFRKALDGNSYPWMTDTVRKEALHKLDVMNITINSYDHIDFQKFFHGLSIDRYNYVANIQAILRHREALRPNKLQPPITSLDTAGLFSYTPVYKNSQNTIIIPVGVLQPYFIWHPIYPQTLKFATLGNLLAHEMIHGFDDTGRQFDGYGQLRDWWDKESETAFEERRHCFQQQYHKYVYNGVRLPLQSDQAENIADNAAIRLAFAAYSQWWHDMQEVQPELNIKESFSTFKVTNWELFFISYAQMWCDDVHTKYLNSIIEESSHSPSEFRVIGPLSNFKKFSEIYKCEPGSVMNPRDKCEIY